MKPRMSSTVLIALAIGCVLVQMASMAFAAAPVLYGGLGGHGVSSGPQESTNDGALVIVDQANGSTTVVGHPQGVQRISGLAFGLDGTLFAATQAGGGFPPPPGPDTSSNLIRINRDNGALISSVPIRDGATPLSIADLAVHPTTGVLYGNGGEGGANSRANRSGKLYTINATTGAATLVGDTGKFFASIAFAPDGTLYMASAELLGNNMGNLLLLKLNPANAAIVSSVPTTDFYHSLAVRPSDGVLFGGNGDQQVVYTIDPTTGDARPIGLTGTNLVGDFAFTIAGIDINQHGLTGSWYQAATDGQGIEIEVYPDAIAPGTGLVQGSWFTFDYAAAGGASSQRWYTFSGNAQSGQASATSTLYQNVGGNFNALPPTAPVPVGTVVLTFNDCASASLAFTFSDGSGRSGNVPLTRLTPNVTCSIAGAAPTNADFGYSGNWFSAATSGQGFVFELNPNAAVVFFAWYTYAPNGQRQGAAGQRWYTGQASYAQGARSLPVTFYETTGGLFNSTTPPAHSAVVGTGTATFLNCGAARLNYAFSAGSSAGAAGTIELTRVGPIPPGCGP